MKGELEKEEIRIIGRIATNIKDSSGEFETSERGIPKGKLNSRYLTANDIDPELKRHKKKLKEFEINETLVEFFKKNHSEFTTNIKKLV